MHSAVPATAVAAAGALLWLLAGPASADLAAQAYRVDLFEREGFTLLQTGWYAGHHTPGYSVLFPPLGALLGTRLAGAVAAVAAAGLFAALAHGRWGDAARPGALWFAAGVAAWLLTGRLTFLLGVAVGLGALLALQRDRRVLAALLALATGAASPVAALFVALAAVAWGVAGGTQAGGRSGGDADRRRRWGGRPISGDADRGRRRWGAGLAAAALGPVAALALLFPEGGSHPYDLRAFLPALAWIALAALLLPVRERALRAGAVLYALGCVLAFVVATPVGGNANRLGALAAGPIALCALLAAPRRVPVALAAVALAPLAAWQLYAPVRDAARGIGDPSTRAAFHEPLLQFLARQPGDARVEVPMLANHGEAVHVAPHAALARGWSRQLDRRHAALFYEEELHPAAYRAWIDEHAVRFVALADAPLDGAAEAEAALVRRGLPWLVEVWRAPGWRVFAVADPAPPATGAAAIEVGVDAFALDVHRPGVVDVRLRHSRWWRVTQGDACVRRAPDGFVRLQVHRAGPVRVQARLRGSSCRGAR